MMGRIVVEIETGGGDWLGVRGISEALANWRSRETFKVTELEGKRNIDDQAVHVVTLIDEGKLKEVVVISDRTEACRVYDALKGWRGHADHSNRLIGRIPKRIEHAMVPRDCTTCANWKAK